MIAGYGARRSWGVRAGLVLIGLLLAVGWGAPMLASSHPIVCRHEGRLRFPAVVDALANLPLLGGVFQNAPPFNYPGFDARATLGPDAAAWWTPVGYGPLEMGDEILTPPSSRHLLGTDDRGRDILARVLHGTTISMQVAFWSVLLAAAIGIVVGALAGYAGGWIDAILSRLIEIVICFPTFFLILAVMVWIEPDMTWVILVIGLTQWTTVARLARAEFLRLKSADFVLAARTVGASPTRIVLRHILPCALAPLTVTLTLAVADAVLIEAAISWLGFGVPTPAPSWGNMLRSAYDQLRSAPHLVYPPCVAIIVSVMAFHLLGEGLRSRLNPKSALQH